MRRSGAPRLHRLPQFSDFPLIPAPLDLTLPLVDEKDPLPAIIVTPSSPCHETDFSIAFLAPKPKPSVRERLSSLVPALPQVHLPSQIKLPQSPFRTDFERSSLWSMKARARTTFLVMILFFIVTAHLIMHRLASGRPHLDFLSTSSHDIVAFTGIGTGDSIGLPVDVSPLGGSSRHFRNGWRNHGPSPYPVVSDGKRDPDVVIPEKTSDPVSA